MKLGKAVALKDLPPGSIFKFRETYAVKSEYFTDKGAVECVIIGSGEMFWGGTTDPLVQRMLKVNPVIIRRLTK